jgi:methylmalonyl-CoA mutase cobalamin-binding subunit
VKKILGASIGNCIHTVGVLNFLNLAEKLGFKTIYLGGAVSIKELIGAIIETNPEIVAISYRLGKDPLKNLLLDLERELKNKNLLENRIFLFGGTKETGETAREFSFIYKVFDGTEEIEDVIDFLKIIQGEIIKKKEKKEFPQSLKERINWKSPFPLFRHHIGLPSLEETIEEVEKLADSGLLDIISIAPDQNTQSYFFEPEKMDPKQDGAGGVPLRKREDFLRLYNATRRGNFPLLRCYSGTRNLIEFSKLLKETINNAWSAIPLTWYSELDRRSDRELLSAIKENMLAIKWNAENGIPVEINESHQWELRNAHDAIRVATCYISALVAKKLGVKEYVAQYMLNTPPNISPKMDIAKALAKIELVESLHDENFVSYRMIRTGLLSFPADSYSSMGQLVASMFYGSYLKPHIIHVVSYCEALYPARSKEIIESVKMVKRAYILAQWGLPDFSSDPEICERKEELKEEAIFILSAIKSLAKSEEDFLSPENIYNAIKFGILDAPLLKGFSIAKGEIRTSVINGANFCVDERGRILKEKERIERLI